MICLDAGTCLLDICESFAQVIQFVKILKAQIRLYLIPSTGKPHSLQLQKQLPLPGTVVEHNIYSTVSY